MSQRSKSSSRVDDEQEEERQNERITNACISCRTRKRRCGGEIPACQQCLSKGVECIYSIRRMRGPGRRKGHIRELEQRLQRLESTVPPQNSQDDEAPSASRPQPDLQAGNEVAGEDRGPREIQTPKDSIPMPYISNLPINNTRSVVTPNIKVGPFTVEVFASPLPPSDTQNLINSVADSICQVYPFFALLYDTGHHSQQTARNSMADWAISNCLAAIAIQWKAANNSVPQVSQFAWSYFKNSFAAFPSLVIQAPSIKICQALILMAIFLHGSGDTRTCYHLMSIAARTAQVDLLTREKVGLDRTTSNTRQTQRLLQMAGIAYILDTELSIRSGLPPTVTDDELSIDFADIMSVSSVSTEDQSTEIGKCRAKLAVIVSKMTGRGHQPTQPSDQPGDHAQTHISQLNSQLESWKGAMPAAYRYPNNNGEFLTSRLHTSILFLHLGYYSSKMKLITLLRSPPSPIKAVADDLKAERSSAAEFILHLLPPLSDAPFACLWRILVYHVAASITLLADILKNPTSTQRKTKAGAIGELVAFLRQIVHTQGCTGLHAMLEGCTKIHEITSASNLSFSPWLHDVLRSDTNHLVLAQGLMGNTSPHPDSGDLAAFCRVLELDWDPQDEFGPFVPDDLKPCSHEFTFGFGESF